MDVPPDQVTFCIWSSTVIGVSSHVSMYLIVVMTFERFYSILRPHKAASFNTIKRAKITISCIILVSIVYTVPHLFITSASGRTCVNFLKGMKYLSGRIYFFVDQVVSVGIPFISLLVMNCVIIYNLYKRPKFLTNKSLEEGQNEDQCQGQSQGHSQGHRNTRHPEKQIITMLLVVTFSYLILMIPAYSMLFYIQFVDFRSSPKLYAGFYLFSAIGRRSYFTNFGINFYLYVISGQKFRKDLIRLFQKMLLCISH